MFIWNSFVCYKEMAPVWPTVCVSQHLLCFCRFCPLLWRKSSPYWCKLTRDYCKPNGLPPFLSGITIYPSEDSTEQTNKGKHRGLLVRMRACLVIFPEASQNLKRYLDAAFPQPCRHLVGSCCRPRWEASAPLRVLSLSWLVHGEPAQPAASAAP